MQLNVSSMNGKTGGGVDVAEAAFGVPFNEALVHQVVVAYQAGARAGTKAQRNRALVRGGGSKPHRQKGTGRARAGTIRSPLWRGGGTVFAAVPRDYAQKVNRKMYRSALRAIFSELVRQQRLTVVEDLSMAVPKTKQLAARLAALEITNVLLVTEAVDDNLILSARNLRGVEVCSATQVNPVSLILHNNVVCSVGALNRIQEVML